MPAFNEGATIREAVMRCIEVLNTIGEPYELIVVDDGSSDGTREILLSIESPNLVVSEARSNFGKGRSLIDGWRKSKGEYICFIDADLDIDSRGISHFYHRLSSPDLPVDGVVGSKTHPDSRVSYPIGRRVQSRVFKRLVKVMFGLSIADTQTGLKMFNRRLLDSCLPEVHTEGFAFDLELLALAHLKGFRLVEEPVHVDFQFTSSVDLWTAAQMLRDTVKIWRRIRQLPSVSH